MKKQRKNMKNQKNMIDKKNMKNGVSILLSLAILTGILTGIGYALTPPPPPPVNQAIGMYDTSIDFLVTNATDQGVCRQCHQTSVTNISGGYNNTVGGVPTRHHNLLPENKTNPKTNTPFGCQDCHPSTLGILNGILLDRSCTDCHNGTDFYADAVPLNAHVGNFSRPHHVNTSYDDANIGNPAANRTCSKCHGSFVNDYNDGHYTPSYNTSFNITPFATFKITNFSQPDGLGGNKTWGGCLSCHVDNPGATPLPIGENLHHKEILGFAGLVDNSTPFQNLSTPGAKCSWCHVIDYTNSTGNGPTFPLRFNITNTFIIPNELLIGAMELRNSTSELGNPALEIGTTNITINGTGCEKCHSVKSLHNIQFNYSENGQQGLGHINDILDCSGCHNSWLPADILSIDLIPTLNSVSPSVIAVGTATTLTITGSNFVNGDTSVVTVDGVTYTPTPTNINDIQIKVDIPALSTGIHQLQVVKNGDTLSKLTTLAVTPNVKITTAKLNGGTITITGLNFGTKPAINARYYISVNHAGNQIVSTSISGWSSTQIKAKNSAAEVGDWVTVMTKNAGEVKAQITR